MHDSTSTPEAPEAQESGWPVSNVIVLDLYRELRSVKSQLSRAFEFIDYVLSPEGSVIERFVTTPCCGTDPLAIHYDPIQQMVLCEVCRAVWSPKERR